MALSKELEIGHGYTASYHRIGQVIIDRVSGVTNICINSYKDTDARLDINNFVDSRTSTVNGTPTEDILVWAYNQLSLLDTWKDAQSV